MRILKRIKKTVIEKKKEILKMSLAVVFLVILSLGLEILAFGRAYEKEKEVLLIQKENIETNDFEIDNQGKFVSRFDNSKMSIRLNGKHVDVLTIYINQNKGDIISLKYLKEDGGEVSLENKLQKNILKNELDFMPFFTFKIDDDPKEVELMIQKPGAIISQIEIDNRYIFNPYRFFLIFSIVLLGYVLFTFRKIIGEKPERGFLAVSLILGTLLVFSETKSYISWDDLIHYKNVDSISLKNFIRKDVEDIYAKTNSVPHSYSIREQKVIDEYFDSQVKTNFDKNKKKKDFSLYPKELYNKVGYLPSSFALMTGRLLNLPGHIVFMLGRFANVLVYSLLVYFAIKKLSSGKMLMATIALFPTSVFLASNYSYDYWVTGFTMLGLSYLFAELGSKEKISKKDLSIMIGSFVIGLGPKAIYFPLMLLLFLISRSKFKNQKDYKKYLLIVSVSILFVLGSFLLPFLISGEGGGDMRGGREVNSAEQVKFILTEPVQYTKILTNFMIQFINPLNGGGFVTSFAYLGSVSGFYIVLVLIFIITLLDNGKSRQLFFDWRKKILMLGIFVSTVALISTALYVAFTPVRSVIINGVQPRYLTPLLFPFLYIIFANKLKNPVNKNVCSIFIFAILSLISFYGAWDLIIKFYF